MKFEDKYPDAEYLSIYDGCMLKGDEQLPCWHCGTPTSFIEINYEAHICSEECLHQIDDEINERCNGLADYEDEFEPGRINVNMFGLNP